MCLIFFAYNSHPKYKFVLSANRDEFLNRPASKISEWDGIYAGKDLQSGGTWLGINKKGKFCAITNIRRIEQIPNAPTRGKIVTNYLTGKDSPKDYLTELIKDSDKYNGFNLILGDKNSCFHFNNMEKKINDLESGIYGVSNASIDTPWPKLEKGKKEFSQLLKDDRLNKEDFFKLLRDDSKPPVEQLPETGVGLEWEKILSSIFITSEAYGTRCTSIITMNEKEVNFFERTYDKDHEGDEKISFSMD
ncbi:MAG: NRDE family protein [Deltaproteobacteria bacterium]|nr:NRDE family protein [Deltaproteobacteria bacterium]